MPIFVCIIIGCLCVLLSYLVIEDLIDNLVDKEVLKSISGIFITVALSLGIGTIIHIATADHPQKIMEDYHKGKIETVITTVPSGDNLIKQDTIYRYKY